MAKRLMGGRFDSLKSALVDVEAVLVPDPLADQGAVATVVHAHVVALVARAGALVAHVAVATHVVAPNLDLSPEVGLRTDKYVMHQGYD